MWSADLAAAVAVLAWSVPALAGPARPWRTGSGSDDLPPVPLWPYLYGAAGAVLLSFVVFGSFVGEQRAPGGYPRLTLG